MKEIWIEKYRPETLNDVIGQEHVVNRLKSYVASNSLPHLMFAGPAGTGKTTCALALAREIFQEDWKSNFHELNASDERGIKTVRVNIKEYARTAAIGSNRFKIIFLDEADSLTSEAQAALRRMMEKYTFSTRFILSCNYSSKIIEPIQSRCAVFRFRRLGEEDVKKYIERVTAEEGIKIDDGGMSALLYIAEGDLRKATNALQVAYSLGETITADLVHSGTATARPEEVKSMLQLALGGDFIGARRELDRFLVEVGLSGEDLIKQIHKEILKLGLRENAMVALLDKVGETEFRLVEGSNQRIQLESLLAHFSASALK
ncbi:MAG: replication factor C small subunit [Candidatus Thermoplasmatota archaeon]|nr:replication factor C small subunit [Candidatus Thermoplasmatota archaeon]